MTADALIARMAQDAQTRIAALRAGADAEVAALLEASASASSRDREQKLAARRAARVSAFAVDRAGALRRAATRVVTAQHALLDRVFARAESLAIAACPDPHYIESLPQHVASVLRFLGGQPATLRCRPELAAHLRPLLSDARHVELVLDETMPAGISAIARDGSYTIDCTLPARLSASRPQLEAGVLARVPT